MKKARSEKKRRNKSITRAVKSGRSTRKVGRSHGISNKRAWDIAERGKKKRK